MTGKKLWYFMALCMMALLPLAGCSGNTGSGLVTQTEGGTKVSVDGQVTASASANKAATPIDENKVEVYNAQDGATLGSATVAADGTFSGLEFTLPTSKTILVFKATVKAGTYLSIVPIDLSNPPTAGIIDSNPISILINAESTKRAQLVSKLLGLSGDLGDAGQTLVSVTKTYTDAALLVVNNGGQQLAYGGSGLALTGTISNASLLPVAHIAAMTDDQLKPLGNSLKVSGIKVVIPGNFPIINFQVTDAKGKGVAGLTPSRVTIATLVPGSNGAPDEWMNYLLRKNTGLYNGWPTSDAGGSLIDNGDGSYVYIFGTSIKKDAPHGKTAFHPVDVDYVNTQTHRIGFTFDYVPTGATARVTTVPTTFDFVPAGGALTVSRDVSSVASCNACHTDLTTVLTKSGGTHSRGRGDVKFCVMCHTKQAGAVALIPASQVKTSAADSFGDGSTSFQVADGEVIGYFPVMIHKMHMGNKLSKSGYNFVGIKLNDFKYPTGNTVVNCTQCHDTEKAPQAGNMITKPTRMACGSCHDNINFATGANSKVGGRSHFATNSDATCVMCHGDSQSPSPIAEKHAGKLTVAQDASKRTMSATITGVTVDANGGVTATFTVKDGNEAVTDITKFTKPSFSLVKLVKGDDGAYKWVSYTANYRTKDAAMAPVLQGRTENTGSLTANADGSFSYKFKLANGSTEGDIRTIDHAHNASATTLVPNTYTPANWPQGPNVVAYEPTKTHRVAMTFQKVGTPNVDANNAWFDFVPAGGAVKETRNIVTMKNCAGCHANSKLHAAYEIEVCVTCHTQDTKDSLTGQSVDIQTLVHKLHMGKNLPSVKAGGEYRINSAAGGSHDYTKASYPGLIKNCQVCHVEGTGAPANASNWRTTPTANACITCHDSGAQKLHADQNVNSCISCHGSTKSASAVAVHNK